VAGVVYADSAKTDLLEIWLYIADNNLDAADRVLDAIDRESMTLALQPRMGRMRPELAPGVRSWPTSTSYIVFYTPQEQGIAILRVLHHARDIQNLDTNF
jgi:toxin ParE1/3/4